MSDMIEFKKNEAGIWEETDSLSQIKSVFAPTLTNLEFSSLVQLGKATQLNPFLKEIWAVKYGTAPAQIFIGRDGYRKSAQRSPSYDYHEVFSVYANDDFSVINGEVSHKFKLSDRGRLIGAYCIVKRRGSSKPVVNIVNFDEYSTGKSLWKAVADGGKPDTLIKKVAEAQGLRASFQELFSGTYHELEDYKQPQEIPEQKTGTYATKAALGLLTKEDPIDRKIEDLKEVKEYPNLITGKSIQTSTPEPDQGDYAAMLNRDIELIENMQTIDGLKALFIEMADKYKGKKMSTQMLIDAKNKRKLELMPIFSTSLSNNCPEWDSFNQEKQEILGDV